MVASSDTIYALSSGALPAAIAVVRVSGAGAGAALSALVGQLPQPRRASLRTIRSNAGVLDHGLILWFPGPATATGEDLAELHLHGSRAVVAAVFRALQVLGLRQAEPGEFTRRALLNGRLTLDEAEGLADLLQAETEWQRVEALRRSEGAIGRMIAGWTQRLVDIAAQIEALIDHDDDGELNVDTGSWRPNLRKLADDVRLVLDTPPVERLRSGVRIAIVGPPNAGKSTLFNALVGHDAAIVSPIAGTTRDVIERPVSLEGRPVLFIDTAGLRDTTDAVEAIGVARAQQAAQAADILIDLAGQATLRSIPVAAKADVEPGRAGALPVSALTGLGMADLRARLLETVDQLLPTPDDVTIERRYRDAFTGVMEALKHAAEEQDVLLAAEWVRHARACLNELTGGATLEDVWDALFGRFCLGK